MDFAYMLPAIKVIRQNQGAGISTCIIVSDNDEEKLLKTTLQTFSFYPMLGGLYNRYGLGNGAELNVCVADSRRTYRSFMRAIDEKKIDVVTSFPIPANWKDDVPAPVMDSFNYPKWWGSTPRVSAPWSDEEERYLLQEVEARLKMKEICRRHGRAEGGIRSRMSKLLGQGFEYHPEQAVLDILSPQVLPSIECPLCSGKHFKIVQVKD